MPKCFSLYSSVLRSIVGLVLVACAIGNNLVAQSGSQGSPKVVQISGRVMTEENEKLIFLPFATVAVKGTNRGTYTDFSGFYSIVVTTDETLVFSVLGYKDVYFPVPDTLTRDRYTFYHVLYKDTFLLPTAVVYPWPDPDNFTQEFLAMDVHDDLEDIAAENLSDKAMEQLREYLPSDGIENTSFYLRQKSQSYYYEGQVRPMNIFNVFAWKEFVEAWKRGDFKKKK